MGGCVAVIHSDVSFSPSKKGENEQQRREEKLRFAFLKNNLVTPSITREQCDVEDENDEEASQVSGGPSGINEIIINQRRFSTASAITGVSAITMDEALMRLEKAASRRRSTCEYDEESMTSATAVNKHDDDEVILMQEMILSYLQVMQPHEATHVTTMLVQLYTLEEDSNELHRSAATPRTVKLHQRRRSMILSNIKQELRIVINR